MLDRQVELCLLGSKRSPHSRLQFHRSLRPLTSTCGQHSQRRESSPLGFVRPFDGCSTWHGSLSSRLPSVSGFHAFRVAPRQRNVSTILCSCSACGFSRVYRPCGTPSGGDCRNSIVSKDEHGMVSSGPSNPRLEPTGARWAPGVRRRVRSAEVRVSTRPC